MDIRKLILEMEKEPVFAKFADELAFHLNDLANTMSEDAQTIKEQQAEIERLKSWVYYLEKAAGKALIAKAHQEQWEDAYLDEKS